MRRKLNKLWASAESEGRKVCQCLIGKFPPPFSGRRSLPPTQRVRPPLPYYFLNRVLTLWSRAITKPVQRSIQSWEFGLPRWFHGYTDVSLIRLCTFNVCSFIVRQLYLNEAVFLKSQRRRLRKGRNGRGACYRQHCACHPLYRGFFKLRIQAGPLGGTYFQQQNYPERTSFQTFVPKFPHSIIFFIFYLVNPH